MLQVAMDGAVSPTGLELLVRDEKVDTVALPLVVSATYEHGRWAGLLRTVLDPNVFTWPK